MLITKEKYMNLLEDYTELKQTNDACRTEYLRIYNQLNEIKSILFPPRKNKIPKKNRLTQRQEEIMEYVAKGLSNEEIAEKMCVTVNSVKVHVHNILTTFKATNRVKAVLIYLRDYKGIDLGDILF